MSKIKLKFLILVILVFVLHNDVLAMKSDYMEKMLNTTDDKVIHEYCMNSNQEIYSGIGDRLEIMANLINYKIAFNKDYFISTGCNSTHTNMGLKNFFSELPNNKIGKINVRYSFKTHNPTFYQNVLYRDWSHSNEHVKEMYELLNIDKKKSEVLKKYNIPKDYFDNTISLHIRCGDTKTKRVEKYEYYYNAVKYINQKTGANKVICFYENDDFSTNIATGIISKLKKDFPNIEFKKCLSVETDGEELLMMSMCKHNIQSFSGFTKWATNFNSNPGKVIFKNNNKAWQSYNGIGFCDYISK